jgi:hypothetical protein
MVEMSSSGSGEGPGWETGRGYSTAAPSSGRCTRPQDRVKGVAAPDARSSCAAAPRARNPCGPASRPRRRISSQRGWFLMVS